MKKYNDICPECKKKVEITAWKYCSDECGRKVRNRLQRLKINKQK